MSNKQWVKKYGMELIGVLSLLSVVSIPLACSTNYEHPKSLEYQTIPADPSYHISEKRILKYNIIHISSEAKWLDVTNVKMFKDKVIFDHDFFRVTVNGDYVVESYYENAEIAN